jgi:hypothetical protein
VEHENKGKVFHRKIRVKMSPRRRKEYRKKLKINFGKNKYMKRYDYYTLCAKWRHTKTQTNAEAWCSDDPPSGNTNKGKWKGFIAR